MELTQKIKKLFIANRGEICRRVATTAKEMGIVTATISDQKSPPDYLRNEIDDFIKVTEESSSLYLNQSAMIELAKNSGCDAIHPGFGFLSENADFAKKCRDENLTWVGPSPESISRLANKAEARKLAEQANVPCTPGLEGFHVPKDENGDFSELERFAEKTGFPLLMKAAMGGGGKGMRLVRKMSELKQAALRATSEGLSSFGDGTLICERYVEHSRHVEVQIMADKHGNVYAVGDRDCSAQRRHQKIIEESPAPFLGEKTRELLHSSAVALAKTVGYENAGTVEFLVEWTDEVKHKELQPVFFLEMNTRLQVEHPVTEQVHGLDLVACQLKVAQGEVLNHEQLSSPARGHSVEARLYAENVFEKFFPSPGKVKAFLPALSNAVRWEVGIDTMDEITPKFDPMIAKVIATGQNRIDSFQKLAKALKDTVYIGPASNRDYLITLLEDPVFSSESVTTSFVEEAHERMIDRITAKNETFSKEVSSLLDDVVEENFVSNQNTNAYSPSPQTQTRNHIFFSTRSNYNSSIEILGTTFYHPARYKGHSLSKSSFVYEGKTYITATYLSPTEKTVLLQHSGMVTLDVQKFGLSSASAANSSDGAITAEVPGKILEIKTAPGDKVSKGQTLFVLESMKMEFEIKATKDGEIEQISVVTNEQVTSGKTLACWKESR